MPMPVIGQPMLGPNGQPVKDLQGRPVIYHGQLLDTQRDAQGRTVWTYEDGAKVYAQPTDDLGHILPSGIGQDPFHEGSDWNAQTGQYEQGGLNWGTIMGLVAAGVVSAGAASALLGGAAAGSAGSSGVEAGASAGLGTDAAAGTLGSAAAGSSAMGLGTGAATTGAATAGASASPWLADGTFAGDSTFGSTAAASGSGPGWGSVLSYGVPAAEGAINSYVQHGQFEDELELRRQQLAQPKQIADQKTALDESTLDPFRGYMAQGRDMARFDALDQGQPARNVSLDPKYGAGLNVQPNQGYMPSALTRQVLQAGRQSIANGRTVPTVTNPNNYGQTPVVSLDGSNPAGAPTPTAPVSAPINPDDRLTAMLMRIGRSRRVTA